MASICLIEQILTEEDIHRNFLKNSAYIFEYFKCMYLSQKGLYDIQLAKNIITFRRTVATSLSLIARSGLRVSFRFYLLTISLVSDKTLYQIF